MILKIDKIIYITSHNFRVNHKKQYGMEYFLDKNIEVEILDITSYVYPNIDIPMHTFKNISLIEINTFNSLENYILKQNSSNTVFINFAGESNCIILMLLEILYKNKMLFSTINFGEVSVTKSIFSRLSKITISKILKKIKLKICKKQVKFEYSFFISTNDNPNTKFFYKKHIHIHSFDYDLYIESLSNNKKLIDKKYAVFLDTNVIFHPDDKLLNIKYNMKLDANKYYKNLDKIFTIIEKNYNVKICFALHPSFNLNQIDYLMGRKYFINKTVELVKNSEFCLTHGSTSINFAVLYKKPILFIKTEEIKAQSSLLSYLKESAEILNSNIIDSDKLFEKIDIKKVDNKKYEDYKYRYIKNNLSEEYTWEYVLNEVEKNLNEK